MIPRLQAVHFHRFMRTGRTFPALCGCEDPTSETAWDVVVKLRDGLDRGDTALTCELVASRIAAYFNLPVPEPALVLIETDFADIVAEAFPERAERIRKSVGLNFGSRQLADVSTWAIDRAIPEAMWESAVSIFAFDALI